MALLCWASAVQKFGCLCNPLLPLARSKWKMPWSGPGCCRIKRKAMAKKTPSTVAENRRARHEYLILSTFEAGIMLLGTEVKSLREGGASIAEAHAAEKQGEVYLFNANIPV